MNNILSDSMGSDRHWVTSGFLYHKDDWGHSGPQSSLWSTGGTAGLMPVAADTGMKPVAAGFFPV